MAHLSVRLCSLVWIEARLNPPPLDFECLQTTICLRLNPYPSLPFLIHPSPSLDLGWIILKKVTMTCSLKGIGDQRQHAQVSTKCSLFENVGKIVHTDKRQRLTPTKDLSELYKKLTWMLCEYISLWHPWFFCFSLAFAGTWPRLLGLLCTHCFSRHLRTNINNYLTAV